MALTIGETALEMEPIAGPTLPTARVAGDSSVLIGRGGGATLVLEDSRVSRRHAVLQAWGGWWYLSDLGSRHGTLLNGWRIGTESPVPVRDGDVIGIQPWIFRVCLGAIGPRRVLARDQGATPHESIERIRASHDALDGSHAVLLARLSNALHAAPTEALLGTELADTVVSVTRASRVVVARPREGGGSVEVVVDRQPPSELAEPSRDQPRLDVRRALVQMAMEGEPCAATTDAAHLESLDPSDTTPADVPDGGNRVMVSVCYPIRVAHSTPSVMLVEPGEAPLRESDLAFMHTASRLASSALSELWRRQTESRRDLVARDLSSMRHALQGPDLEGHGRLGSTWWTWRMLHGRIATGTVVRAAAAPGGREAVLVLDVGGRGCEGVMRAAVVMSAIMTSLQLTGDPDAAAAAAASCGVTGPPARAWIGVHHGGRWRVVNAGLDAWVMQRGDRTLNRMPDAGAVEPSARLASSEHADAAAFLVMSRGAARSLGDIESVVRTAEPGMAAMDSDAAGEVLGEVIRSCDGSMLIEDAAVVSVGACHG